MRPSPGAAGTTTPFDHNVTSRGERTQQGVHQATPVPEAMTDQEQLASLQLRAAMAEATARLVAAEQATALGRRTTAEHLLESEITGGNSLQAQSFQVPYAAQLPRGTAHV